MTLAAAIRAARDAGETRIQRELVPGAKGLAYSATTLLVYDITTTSSYLAEDVLAENWSVVRRPREVVFVKYQGRWQEWDTNVYLSAASAGIAPALVRFREVL